MTRADMDEVRDQFVASARAAAEAGFDLLELHMAHGYLLSSFLSPLTNRRDDEYGGSLEGRARYPLEVFAACRAVWPQERPMSVRISATDWFEGRLRRRPGGGVRRAAAGGGLRHRRRVERPGLARPAAGVRPQLPDAVRRPDPQRGRHPDDRGRGDLQLRRRQHDRPRRPGGPVRARAPAPLRPALDAARRRGSGLHARRVGAAVPLGLAAAERRQGRRDPPGAGAALRPGPADDRSARPRAGGRG